MQQSLVEVDDGVRLAVHRTGTGSPPLICLNAAGGAHAEWTDLVDRLSAHTQVIRPDARPSAAATRFPAI